MSRSSVAPGAASRTSASGAGTSVSPARSDDQECRERAGVEPRLEEGSRGLRRRGEGVADVAGEVDEQVGAPLDEQVLAHLEGEGEDGREVVRTRPPAAAPRPRAARAAAPSPRFPPREAGRAARARPAGGAAGRTRRTGRQRQVPLWRRGIALPRAARLVVFEVAFLLLFAGDEALGRGHLDPVKPRLAQERDQVVLLLAHAGEADREDLEQPQPLVPGGLGGEGDPAHAVAEEAEGERALAVPLEVDHLAAEAELEGVDVEDERPEALEDRPEAVAVVRDQRADHLVRRVVQREAPRGAGEGQDRGVGSGGVGAADQRRSSGEGSAPSGSATSSSWTDGGAGPSSSGAIKVDVSPARSDCAHKGARGSPTAPAPPGTPEGSRDKICSWLQRPFGFLRVAAACPPVSVADPEGNADATLDFVARAAEPRRPGGRAPRALPHRLHLRRPLLQPDDPGGGRRARARAAPARDGAPAPDRCSRWACPCRRRPALQRGRGVPGRPRPGRRAQDLPAQLQGVLRGALVLVGARGARRRACASAGQAVPFGTDLLFAARRRARRGARGRDLRGPLGARSRPARATRWPAPPCS